MPIDSTAEIAVTAAATMKLDLKPVAKSASCHAARKLSSFGSVGQANPVTRSLFVCRASDRMDSAG